MYKRLNQSHRLGIIKQHQLRLTNERVEDFRSTLFEIVDIKNGKQPIDFNPDV